MPDRLHVARRVPCTSLLRSEFRLQAGLSGCVRSGTGILPVRFRGIGVPPMLHGRDAHATKERLLTHPLRVFRRSRRYASLAAALSSPQGLLDKGRIYPIIEVVVCRDSADEAM